MKNKTTFIRVEKNRNYSVISNEVLRRDDLSWKAKGIMAYVLTLPDDWHINMNELKNHATDGESSFRSGWKELEEAGYVYREPVRDGQRIKYWQTVIRENVDVKPSSELCGFQEVENLDVENLDVENLDVENRNLLSTYNTKYLTKPNTNNTKDNSRLENDTPPYGEIVDYLNKKAGKQFKHTTKKTQSLIKARLNEGFEVDDFKKVIDVKTEEWLNDNKMSQYLRPETLFGTKFESYLNQPLKRKQEYKYGSGTEPKEVMDERELARIRAKMERYNAGNQ